MSATKLALHTEITKELARRRDRERRIQTMEVVGLVAAVAVDQGSFVVLFTLTASFA